MRVVDGQDAASKPSRYLCAGCGFEAPFEDLLAFRCPLAAESPDIDHVMTRILDPSAVRVFGGPEQNPFLRYRELFHAYHVAIAAGWSARDYGDLVRGFDEAVAAVDGRGFLATPWVCSDALSETLGFRGEGGIWIKDETRNVAGSHKGRHLMAVMIHLELASRLGRFGGARPPLAIASCGNAALAAAVLAKTAAWPLHVMIPERAHAAIVERLWALGARLHTCVREGAGDPCMHELRRQLERGAVPFSCQGTQNGVILEGGATLGYEIVSELAARRWLPDRLMIQVGGGALASSMIHAFRDGMALGMVSDMPRIHAVQAAGAAPLRRAYEGVAARILAGLRQRGVAAPEVLGDEDRAQILYDHAQHEVVEEALRYAATHRSEFMWPWEDEPRSVADAILDDETYDWLAIVRGMIEYGGYPVVVPEETLVEAHRLTLARACIAACPTGSAGLAGLLHLVRRGDVDPEETVGVLMTGVDRQIG